MLIKGGPDAGGFTFPVARMVLGADEAPDAAFIAAAPTIADDLLAALDAATAALREIIGDAPDYLIEDDYTTCEDAFTAGDNARHFACAEIARRALGMVPTPDAAARPGEG